MKKLLTRFKKDQRGLTLVELLAVVVILAIVSAIAFVVIGNVIENSKKDAVVADAQQLISAGKLYEANGGDLSTAKSPTDLGNIDSLIDPWTKKNYKDAKVVKDNGEYKATITTEGGKCNIAGKTTEELSEGRDAVCGK